MAKFYETEEQKDPVIYDEENFAERRMNCRQRCMSGKTCHYCVDQIKFMETILKYRNRKIIEKSNLIENN